MLYFLLFISYSIWKIYCFLNGYFGSRGDYYFLLFFHTSLDSLISSLSPSDQTNFDVNQVNDKLGNFYGITGQQQQQGGGSEDDQEDDRSELPGIFRHWNPKPEWDRTDALVLSAIGLCFVLKMCQNYILTGSCFVAHPDYTEPGLFWLVFDMYDPTSEYVNEGFFNDLTSSSRPPSSFVPRGEVQVPRKESWWVLIRRSIDELKWEYLDQFWYHDRLTEEDRRLLQKYRYYKTEDLRDLPDSVLRRLRWARSHEYDKWKLFKNWKSKYELPDRGRRVEFWSEWPDYAKVLNPERTSRGWDVPKKKTFFSPEYKSNIGQQQKIGLSSIEKNKMWQEQQQQQSQSQKVGISSEEKKKIFGDILKGLGPEERREFLNSLWSEEKSQFRQQQGNSSFYKSGKEGFQPQQQGSSSDSIPHFSEEKKKNSSFLSEDKKGKKQKQVSFLLPEEEGSSRHEVFFPGEENWSRKKQKENLYKK